MHVRTVSDFRRFVRSGPYAWPGGYDVIFTTSDGGTLCYKCTDANRREIVDSMARVDVQSGWHVSGVFLSCDTDGPIECDHCGKTLVNDPESY